MRIAVTGATGYIGGRLVPQLIAAGHEVVCLARTPEKLRDRAWIEDVEVREADVLDADTLTRALDGCDAAFYLVHSMGSGADFEERDRTAARNFGAASTSASLRGDSTQRAAVVVTAPTSESATVSGSSVPRRPARFASFAMPVSQTEKPWNTSSESAPIAWRTRQGRPWVVRA